MVFGNSSQGSLKYAKGRICNNHFVAVDAHNGVVVNNTNKGAFLRFCDEAFDKVMPHVYMIYKLEAR